MYGRLLVAILFTSLSPSFVSASGLPPIPFIDGRWQGDIAVGQGTTDFRECWASTVFVDGTTFTLIQQADKIWHLRLSNPSWRLPQYRRYAIEAQVDFYPTLNMIAKAKNPTLLEIEDLEKISLLGLIENGHTMDLKSDVFNDKYDLEGSAKVITRIRNCFKDQTVSKINSNSLRK